jgi:hypothetical protein
MLTTWQSLSQKLALTSPTNGGRLVGIVHLRTQAMDFLNIVETVGLQMV